MNEWIDVEKMLPSQTKAVRWLHKNGQENVGFFDKRDENFKSWGVIIDTNNPITHWKFLNEKSL